MCLLAVLSRRRRPARNGEVFSFSFRLGSCGWIFAGFGRKGNGFVGVGVSVWLGLGLNIFPLFVFDLFWTKPATASSDSWYRHLEGPGLLGGFYLFLVGFFRHKFLCFWAPAMLTKLVVWAIQTRSRRLWNQERIPTRFFGFCCRSGSPFRSIEVVFRRGTEEMPWFSAICSVSSLIQFWSLFLPSSVELVGTWVQVSWILVVLSIHFLLFLKCFFIFLERKKCF